MNNFGLLGQRGSHCVSSRSRCSSKGISRLHRPVSLQPRILFSQPSTFLLRATDTEQQQQQQQQQEQHSSSSSNDNVSTEASSSSSTPPQDPVTSSQESETQNQPTVRVVDLGGGGTICRIVTHCVQTTFIMPAL
jgi:hypothetical protein